MKPAPFDYYAPHNIEEAINLLARLEDDDIDAKILAGGQSLIPMISLRMARPEALVDLRKLDCLNYIREQDDVITIGAMTSKSAAEDSELIRKKQPVFHRASQLIGHRQIRNRGTVGGSFAHADPAAEYGAAAICLNIEMVVQGPDGERVIPADEFYITYLTTDIKATEILTAVRVPILAPDQGWSFQEIIRRDGDLALAGVAVTLSVKDGLCKNVRIVVFGVNAIASRMTLAEQLIENQAPGDTVFAEAAGLAATSLDEPIGDVHATPEFRRQLTKTLIGRCLAEAVYRAG